MHSTAMLCFWEDKISYFKFTMTYAETILSQRTANIFATSRNIRTDLHLLIYGEASEVRFKLANKLKSIPKGDSTVVGLIEVACSRTDSAF